MAARTLQLNVTLRRAAFTLAVKQELSLDGITAVFGPSGGGKTSLLRIIAGLERSAGGTVTFDGTPWQSDGIYRSTHERRVGYVFQDGRLFAHLNVEQNLRFGWRRAAERTIDLDAAIDAFHLRPLLSRRPTTLSGGERQRVAIARALLASPTLLLMDEPLSSLDASRKREILPHIEQLPQRFDIPVLYVTHNVDEVVRLASHVLLLAAGGVTAYGPVAEIFERTDLDLFSGGLEAGSVLRARVLAYQGGVATLGVGQQQLHVPMAAAAVGDLRPLRIHARDVAIATVRPEKLSIRNILTGKLLRIEPGTTFNVELLLDVDGERLRSRITRDALDELRLTPGQPVFALIKSVALESSLLS